VFPEMRCASLRGVADWSFLTNHARVLVCIAHDPGARLRDIAASLGITERTAHGIITDLAGAGYVVKRKDGRRNSYQIRAHLPLPEPGTREPAVGEVLAVLLGNTDGLASPAGGANAITARPVGHDVPGGREDNDGPGADRPGGDLLPGDDGRAGAAGAM
jgi:MarR family